MERRGRPKATKQQQKNAENVISKDEYMAQTFRYFNENKSIEKQGKVDVIKTQKYGIGPVVMIFKTSNRSNAQTKMKVWNNYNIDYILTAPKLPGIPDKAVILEVGLGDKMVEKYKTKYNID